MPKKKSAVKPTKKQKLSPAERSQIAKDRWATIRAGRAAKKDAPLVETVVGVTIENGKNPVIHTELLPAPPIVEQEKAAALMETVPILINAMLEADAAVADLSPAAPPVSAPAPQLAPVKTPKPKRYTGPKEFSVALKAAENRLAKAIVERAQAAGQLAALNAEIPSLLGIINALKGSGSYATPAAYDFGGAAFQSPIPQYQGGLPEALAAAQVAPPVSRAQGGAVQFSPEVLGELEGPDDDDPDRFIKGPNAGGGWIGG